MAKLYKKNRSSDIQTYNTGFQSIEKMFAFIDEWIPRNYTSSVNQILKEENESPIEPAYIRQIKRERIKNPKIINAMLRVARKNKSEMQKD